MLLAQPVPCAGEG
ncbi:hypothetical protein Q9966_003920, partial [Columba livia]